MGEQSETLGRRIARLRLEHGMTQERLAGIAGVSAQAVSKWENDQSAPDIMLLPVLAKAFDVTVGALLGVESVTEEGSTPTPEPASADAVGEMRVELETVELNFGHDTDDASSSQAPDGRGKATKLRIKVTEADGDHVNLTIPLGVVKFALHAGERIPGTSNIFINGQSLDMGFIAKAVEACEPGTLVEVTESDGDYVLIALE